VRRRVPRALVPVLVELRYRLAWRSPAGGTLYSREVGVSIG